jgi:hypothetical protein
LIVEQCQGSIREGWALSVSGLSDFNASTLAPVGPFGGDHGMKVPSDINELADQLEKFVKNMAPMVDGV